MTNFFIKNTETANNKEEKETIPGERSQIYPSLKPGFPRTGL